MLVDALRELSSGALLARELEPLAELLSMGQAALVLWWIESPTAPREALVDAIARVWLGVLTPTHALTGRSARPSDPSPSA